MAFLSSLGVVRSTDQLIQECYEGNNRTLVQHFDLVKRFVEGESLGSLSRSARNRIYASIRSFHLHNRVTLPKSL
jgi:hypothetical protein